MVIYNLAFAESQYIEVFLKENLTGKMIDQANLKQKNRKNIDQIEKSKIAQG